MFRWTHSEITFVGAQIDFDRAVRDYEQDGRNFPPAGIKGAEIEFCSEEHSITTTAFYEGDWVPDPALVHVLSCLLPQHEMEFLWWEPLCKDCEQVDYEYGCVARGAFHFKAGRLTYIERRTDTTRETWSAVTGMWRCYQFAIDVDTWECSELLIQESIQPRPTLSYLPDDVVDPQAMSAGDSNV